MRLIILMERYLNNEVKKYPHHRVRRTKKRKKADTEGFEQSFEKNVRDDTGERRKRV